MVKKSRLKTGAKEMMYGMRKIAKILDSIHFTQRYTQVIELQSEKIANPDLTLSGQILNDVMNKHSSFYDFAISKARQHERFFKHLVQNQNSKRQFEHQAAESIAKQREIELSDTLSFDEYLAAYFDQSSVKISPEIH